MICIPTSCNIIDLQKYPPEKIVTMENVHLNCWKENKTIMLDKISAPLQDGTRWALVSNCLVRKNMDVEYMRDYPSLQIDTPPPRGCSGGRIDTRFLRPRCNSPLKGVNPREPRGIEMGPRAPSA